MSDENGIKWLVEERDKLLARVAVLENELVRRDAAPPVVQEHFFIEVTPAEARAAMITASTAAIADAMAGRLADIIVRRSLHRLSPTFDGGYRLSFLSPTWKP